ncbi:MAG: hypothetical protein WCA35_13945 [Kovacikia sp.]
MAFSKESPAAHHLQERAVSLGDRGLGSDEFLPANTQEPMRPSGTMMPNLTSIRQA